MGHNITPGKRGADGLRLPLTDFVGWRLAVDCGAPGCARGRAYDVRQLAGMHRGLTVADVLRRLRCNACGGAPASASIRPGPDMRQTRAVDVPLIGPGTV